MDRIKSWFWDGVAWAADIGSLWTGLGWIPKLCRWLLRRRRVVRAGGFEFFPDREALQRAHGPLWDRISNVKAIDALWTTGKDFYEGKKHLDKVRRLLLPNPNLPFTAELAATVGGIAPNALILEVTRTAQAIPNTSVKWYNGPLYHMIILADADTQNGWVHVESILPYSATGFRPSYTVHKKCSERTVQEFGRIFSEMWDRAEKPPGYK